MVIIEDKVQNEKRFSDPNEWIYSAIMWGGFLGIIGHFADSYIAPSASKVLYFANVNLASNYESLSWWINTGGATVLGGTASSHLDRYATHSGHYIDQCVNFAKQYIKKAR